nr:hypothetical protein [uncultured Actinoplanes sp.]
MHLLNRIFLVNSLLVVLVTVERTTPITRVVLQPHAFLSLHQLVQTCVLILASVVTLYWTFHAVSGPRHRWLSIIFVAGTYLYGAGEGLHELASYLLQSRCGGSLCDSLFVDDFYTGNILFFVGAFLMTASLLIAERLQPSSTFGRRDVALLSVNAVVFAATVVAYAAFDTVLVGLVFALVTMVFSLAMAIPVRREPLRHPVTLYTVITYTVGSVVAVALRLF